MDKLINIFVEDITGEFHVRKLARLVKKSPTTISKRLREFKRRGLILYRKEMGHSLFKANTESEEFRQLKIRYNIDKITKSGLINYLEKELNYPEAIILFGSFRKGEDIEKSDIDIAVITSIRNAPNLDKFEKILHHEISLFLFSRDKIEKMKADNKELLNNLVNGIILTGFWELFR
ncbi:MAG: nucleotidyltransferase domain-containing protein [Nanoarchaeota archaeon]